MARARDLAPFARLLASALERGMPAGAAAGLLASQGSSPSFRRDAQGVAAALRDGSTLGAALRRFPGSFPEGFCALADAGEAAGRLPEVLRRLAAHAELLDRNAARFRQLLAYLAAGAAMCAIALGFVTNLNIALAGVWTEGGYPYFSSPSQRFWLSISRSAGATALILLAAAFLGGGVAALIWLAVRRTSAGLWIPAWGRVQRARDLSLFCSVLSMRLSAGEALPDALRLSEDAFPNPYVKGVIREVWNRACDGEPLSQGITAASILSGFFPRTLERSVALAEKRGDLPEALAGLADLYRRGMEQGFELLHQILTPLGVVGLANVLLVSLGSSLAPILRMQSILTSGGDSYYGDSDFVRIVRDVLRVVLPFVMPNGFFLGAVGLVYVLGPRRRARIDLAADHLAMAARRGMPLAEALFSLADDLRGWIGESVRRAARRLEDGSTLSEAMAASPRAFPTILGSMAALGEKSGNLPAFLEGYVRFRRDGARPPSALPYLALYPILIGGIVLFLVVNILPKFKPIFDALGGMSTVPAMARALLAVSDLVHGNSGWILLGAATLAATAVFSWRSERVRGMSGRLAALARGLPLGLARPLRRVPGLGRVLLDRSLHLFCAGLGRILAAGGTLPEAARAVAEAERVPALSRAYGWVATRLSEGWRLSDALREEGLFPRDLAWFVEAGEAAGTLPDHLLLAASHFAARATFAREAAARALVPLCALANGAIVAVVYFGVFAPILKLQAMLAGR